MLEGYQPIDFSSVLGSNPQARNRVGLSQAAMDILANSKWNKAPISSLLSQGLNVKGEAPKREQTLWGRVVDLLSTPAYAIGNAADDALAGHQSSDTDSVMGDIGQVLGGVVTGAGRGIGTGFRGAFADSETAADPKDKEFLDSFLIRFDTHMSAADALKPENREKVRQKLAQKKINQFSDAEEDKYFYKFDKGRVEVTDEDLDEYFKEMRLYGIGASMVGDPLNFVTGFGKAGAASKGAEIPGDVLSGTKNIQEGFKALPESSVANTKTDFGPVLTGKAPGSYKVNLNPGSVQNSIISPSGNSLIKPPAWFNFPKNADELAVTGRATVPVANDIEPNVVDPFDEMLNSWAPGRSVQAERQAKPHTEIFPPASVPNEQRAIAEKLSSQPEIAKLTGDLLRRAATGSTADFARRLSIKYPGVPFPQTEALIQRVSQIPDFARRLNMPAERIKIVGAFQRTIQSDVEAMKIAPKVKGAEVIINEAAETNPVVLEQLIAGSKPNRIPSKNPTRDSKVATEVYDKFHPQILGDSVPSGIKSPGAYKKAVSEGRTARYSGSQQVQMWNQITHQMKNIKTPNRFQVANNILRQVEDMFIAKGQTPLSGFRVADSVPLRLSQVLDAIGPAAAAINPTLLTKILRGEKQALEGIPPEVLQKIEELKAGEALVDAGTVVKGVEAGSKSIDDLIKGPLSAARTEEIVTIGSKVADDITRMSGGSPVAGKNASSAVKASYIPKVPGDGFPVTNTNALLSHPDVSAKLLAKYSNAPTVARHIHANIGGPSPRQLGEMVGPAAKTLEWLGARFNSAYKNADMRPIYLKEATTAKSSVAKRAEYLNRLAKQYSVNDLDLWNDALKGAQGLMEPVSGSKAAELSQEIIKTMENLFGSSGLKNSIALENSVVGRSQLLMKELNVNLRRFGLGEYQFKKAGEGTEWLNSWEKWDVKKPLEFLFKIQNVVEHTVREKIMFDEIASRFGTASRGGAFTHKVNHPRLAGYYFGENAATQINQFLRNLKDIKTPSSKQLQMFDKALSKWKAAVTIYVPSHHIRNMIGDLYFNWLGGVNSSRPYGSALKVMQSQKGRYVDIEALGNLTSPEALIKAMQGSNNPTALGKQTALTMKNGTNVTNDMVYVSAFQNGILPTTRVLEDIPDDAMTALDKLKPLGGRGQKAAHTISEGRDHYVRLAHYIDALKKSNKPFEKAVEEAAAVVRKWHPDGMDLTSFERNVMRRMFPFYSWTRKAFPLIVESLVATPGKVMAIPKANYMLQNMMGIETGPISDPFPYDQLFPDWIREKGIGPVFGPESGITEFLGGDPGYSVINPGNPTMDLISQINNPGKMSLGMLNPAARIPFEMATGKEAQTGAPIDEDYYIKQIPGLSHAGRITGEFGVSDTTKENSSGVNMQAILNLMTAMGFQNTGPYRKSAEFDLRDFLKEQRS